MKPLIIIGIAGAGLYFYNKAKRTKANLVKSAGSLQQHTGTLQGVEYKITLDGSTGIWTATVKHPNPQIGWVVVGKGPDQQALFQDVLKFISEIPDTGSTSPSPFMP